MELILSSPIPIVAVFFIIAIVGVFLFELKMARRKKEKPPPLPPTSIPLPKKEPKSKKKALLVAGGLVILTLILSLPVTLIVLRQRQQVIEQAKEAVEPSPIPTEGQLEPSPTVLPPQATSTPISSQKPPTCLGLLAQPTGGRAPLTVTFEARAQDEDGQVTAFEFEFGDGKKQLVEKDFGVGKEAIQPIEHVYNEQGSFIASVRARNDSSLFSESTAACTITIEVLTPAGATPVSLGIGQAAGLGGPPAGGAIPTASPTVTPRAMLPTTTSQPTSPTQGAAAPELPEAGFSLPTAFITFFGLAFIIAGLVLLI